MLTDDLKNVKKDFFIIIYSRRNIRKFGKILYFKENILIYSHKISFDGAM